MKPNFLYIFLNFIFFLFIGSCSNDKLVDMGLVKKKVNQFSISRKAPLEMPPDMLLRPPKSEKKKNSSNLNNEEISLDNIFADTEISGKNKDEFKTNKSLREKRILKKILNTEAIDFK